MLGAPVTAGAAAQAVPILHVAPGGDSAIVVGASRGSTWLGWEQAHRLIAAGRSFRFYDQRAAVAVWRVQKPVLSPASGSAYNVRLRARSTAKTPLVGLAGATWKVVPRAPLKLDAGLPLEEIAFFVVIPIVSVLTFEAVKVARRRVAER